jgi:hypothetical protein
MKVYEIKYRSIEKEKLEVHTIHICASNIADAFEEGVEAIEAEDFNLIGINLVDNIDIVNFQEPECNCAYCSYIKSNLDQRASFHCEKCDYLVCVSTENWDVIPCKQCGEPIYRKNLELVNGVWEYKSTKD